MCAVRRRGLPCIATGLADRDGALRAISRDSPMFDFAAARRMMVDGQVRTSDVTDLRIIAAMLEVPRERFVPEAQCGAGLSRSRRSGHATGTPARRLLKPMVLAKLIQAAEIGAAATMCSMSAAPPAIRRRCWRGWRASVVALEEDPALARHARENLARGRRRQCRGRDRPAARRLAGRRALRRHPAQRRGRGRCPSGCCASSRRAAGWSASSGGRRRARRCSISPPAGRRARCPIFDAAAPLLAGLRASRRPSYSDTGTGTARVSHSAGVARKTQVSAFFTRLCPPVSTRGFTSALQAAYG